MGVSKNRGGPPKSSILIGFGTIKITIHFGVFSPYFWKHPYVKGQWGVPLTVYPWYLLCSLGILGDYNPYIPTI